MSKKQRTPEFLEAAFQRAKKVLNPRDYAVIFQAARASAGGQAAARNRRDRAAAKYVSGSCNLVEMSTSELENLKESVEEIDQQTTEAPVGGSLAEAIIEELKRRAEDFDEDSVAVPNEFEEPSFFVEVENVEEDRLEFDGRVEENEWEAETGDILEVKAGGKVVGVSKCVVPDSEERIEHIKQRWQFIEKHTSKVPFAGPEDAKLMFVCAAPNALEVARLEGVVGDDAVEFSKSYLEPIGLKKSDVVIGFIMPVLPVGTLDAEMCAPWADHFVEGMKKYSKAHIVAIGRVAREVLKKAGVECISLPHPSITRRKGDRGEVSRKLKSLVRLLDGPAVNMQNHLDIGMKPPREGGSSETLAGAISEMRKTGGVTCRVVKSAEEKQIVYGVVLDPYKIDLQNDWVPPAEIESTAHGFLKKSRVIGFEHVEQANAQIVESWVEPYPSDEDYQKALRNEPHRAYTRKFGNDVIHSGTWVAGVELGDQEWALHKQGKLDAFSVGGFSFKTTVSVEEMPAVEFVDLVLA